MRTICYDVRLLAGIPNLYDGDTNVSLWDLSTATREVDTRWLGEERFVIATAKLDFPDESEKQREIKEMLRLWLVLNDPTLAAFHPKCPVYVEFEGREPAESDKGAAKKDKGTRRKLIVWTIGQVLRQEVTGGIAPPDLPKSRLSAGESDFTVRFQNRRVN